MSTTIYLISGANRGIGLALATSLVTKRETAFVYAGARNPEAAVALKDLEKKYPTRIAVAKCVSADLDGNIALAKEIERRHGRLDTVIANAAIGGNSLASVIEAPLSDIDTHFRINVYGPVLLLQATHTLLRKSANPRFVTISSEAGSIDGFIVQRPEGAIALYGATKAALNWMTRKIHFENEWLVAFPFSPGPVLTDMFQNALETDTSGLMKPFIELARKPDHAATKILDIIDNSTREKEGGQFVNVEGKRADW